jgi:CheY-like chemotaxis protein/tetratricopeptide (TPR) repeat protein
MATILIVDDDKHIRQILQTLFEQDPSFVPYAPKIVTAGDGEEGLVRYDAEKPDVVITDLLMPRIDGFRFCAEMRQRDVHRMVGLIVTSGVYRDPSVSKRVRDEFGGTFFTKPYQLKDLVSSVAKHLAARISPETISTTSLVMPIDTSQGDTSTVNAFSGEFMSHPLPRLLLDLYDGRATGILDIQRGRVEKRIDFVVGHPIAVSSNQRQETLGHFLVAKNVITGEQHQQALERAQHEGEKIGEALVELGILSTAELLKNLTAQTRFKITSALRWPEGVFSYQPNRDLVGRAKGNALDPALVVFLGLKNTADVDQAARYVERFAGVPLKLAPRWPRVSSAFGRAFGQDLAAAVTKDPRIESIVAGREELTATLPAAEALLVTSCLEPVGRRASSSDARKTFDPIALAELSHAISAEISPPKREATSHPGEADGGEPGKVMSPNDLAETLYEQLFEDSTVAPVPVAPKSEVAPFSSPETDSGAFKLGTPKAPVVTDDHGVEAEKARDRLLSEYLRIQGKDFFGVLELPRESTDEQVRSAFATRSLRFALETYTKYNLGVDYAKLEELHAAYRLAQEGLATSDLRAAYGQEKRASGAETRAARMSTEIAFRDGERRLAAGDLDLAIARFQEAIATQEEVADYHAYLGWALSLRASREAATTDVAPDASSQTRKACLFHLGQALQIDPDHAAAHEFRGRVLSESGRDEESAAYHLERALDAHPPRLGALGSLEQLRSERGEYRLLERMYRKLIHVVTHDRPLTLQLWLSLARVYQSQLGDPDAARTAYLCAARIAPDDVEILQGLAELDGAGTGQFLARAKPLRQKWRQTPTEAAPGLELFQAALEGEHHDAAYLIAGALAYREQASADAQALYQRFRPRFLVRAQRTLEPALWANLRHPDDDPNVGLLMGCLEPLCSEVFPLSPMDLDLGASEDLDDVDLPEPFLHVRAYVASMLSLPIPHVRRVANFGDQIHVGTLDKPMLLVGPKALSGLGRADLCFRLARAMSYLGPGRALGGSRPARLLKTLFFACLKLAAPTMPLEDPDGTIALAHSWLERAQGAVRERVTDLAWRISREQSVNFSLWSRALARSGDRLGLVLCGDVVVAARAAASLGPPDSVDDLLDFALCPEHLSARASLALSVDV